MYYIPAPLRYAQHGTLPACQPMLMMMMTLCYAVCYVPGKSAMKTKVNIDARRTKMR